MQTKEKKEKNRTSPLHPIGCRILLLKHLPQSVMLQPIIFCYKFFEAFRLRRFGAALLLEHNHNNKRMNE
jgi:hypothetical protein